MCIIDIAKKLGVASAILIAHFRNKIEAIAKSKIKFYENKYWINCTYDLLSIDIRIFSSPQIRRLINKLLKHGILIKGRFNTNPFDKSSWYTFNPKQIISNN